MKKTNENRKVEQRNMTRYSMLSENEEEDVVDKTKEEDGTENDVHTAKIQEKKEIEAI